MKTCSGCDSKLSLDSFARKGHGKLQSKCRVCNRAYQKKHYLKNLDAYKERASLKGKAYNKFFSDLKDNKPCADCGVTYRYYVLDWDHRDPSTKVDSVATIKRRRASKSLVLAEIAKCDLVCANCHRIRTHG